MFYNIYGNTIKLPDGRVLKKGVNGLWKDVKTGIEMNEIQLKNLMFSSVFYGNPEGGPGKPGNNSAFQTLYLYIGHTES